MSYDMDKSVVAKTLLEAALCRNSLIEKLMGRMKASPAQSGLERPYYARIAVDFFIDEELRPIVAGMLVGSDRQLINLSAELLGRIERALKEGKVKLHVPNP